MYVLLRNCSEKSAEIQALKVQAIEREGRLRAARSDVMEARAIAAEREAKVTELSRSLSDIGLERTQLRQQLNRTKVELTETQGDLESLADEILAMKDFVLDDSDLAAIDAQLSTQYLGDDEESVNNADVGNDEVEGTGDASNASDDSWEILSAIADLSKQMLEDARKDEEAFLGGSFLKKLTNGVQLPSQKK